MADEETVLVAASDSRFGRDQIDRARGFSWAEPQEGYRLMHSFFSIRRPALREAIVKFVTELSTLDDESQ
jgi:hypothetical protein